MREMKDSGISWIGKIPQDWKLIRLRFLSTIQTGNQDTQDNDPEGEYPFYVRSPHVERSKRWTFDGPAILMAGDGAGAGKVFHDVDGKYGCHQRVYSIQNIHTVNKRLLFYYLMNRFYYMIEVANSKSTVDSVRLDMLLDFPVVMGDEKEQQRIADFLDRKCADIDNVLDKTKSSIEEYKRLKQSVITEAVTKGVRGERPMKDSGSVWFGNIPAEWNMLKLKFVFTIRKRIIGEDGHTVLAITQKGVKPKNMSFGNGQFAESYANYQIVHPGDFAMNHMDLLTGWVDISKYEGVTSPDYRVFTLDDPKNCPSYYLYMMQMCYSNRIFYSMGQGVSGMGRWRLPADMFNNFLISVPSAEEQQEIASYLDQKCSEIDSLIESKERFIKELESYRKSLIYEYVTGKKEVFA